MTRKHNEHAQQVQKQPVFHKVGENLYRLESSGGYYALLKRAGKQFRRSLETKDRQLADRRLAELRGKVGDLTISGDANLTFDQTAKRWLDSIRHSLSESTVLRKEIHLKKLAPFFSGTSIRNITPHHCDRWVSVRGPKIAAQTFAHELEVMKAVFEYAIERGLILSNPCKRIRRKRIVAAKIVVPSREQFILNTAV